MFFPLPLHINTTNLFTQSNEENPLNATLYDLSLSFQVYWIPYLSLKHVLWSLVGQEIFVSLLSSSDKKEIMNNYNSKIVSKLCEDFIIFLMATSRSRRNKLQHITHELSISISSAFTALSLPMLRRAERDQITQKIRIDIVRMFSFLSITSAKVRAPSTSLSYLSFSFSAPESVSRFLNRII